MNKKYNHSNYIDLFKILLDAKSNNYQVLISLNMDHLIFIIREVPNIPTKNIHFLHEYDVVINYLNILFNENIIAPDFLNWFYKNSSKIEKLIELKSFI